ncbi:MAG: alpha/beta fold hydrolase [Gracilimonas sp.]|uniref:YheT family hydrolase n=1 Tax=Gracilimonas sp. TaxID=1974203 RepID=UPI0037505BC8|nr:alpha/beta fold hydrolase [Gracilimonas sp.]
MYSEKIKLEPFEPIWWAWNTHVHTIVASQFMRVQKPNCKRLEIPTPDDDFLEIDVRIKENNSPIVALFHGLEGSTDRYYIANLMRDLERSGFSSAALNFRGCGSRMNTKPRFYHSGETQDYRTFFGWISEQYPDREIYAVGFSLGANALVKYLAEEGSHSLVNRAIAVSPPYDLKAGSLNLHRGFNRVYEVNFLKTLVQKLEEKRGEFPDMPAFSGNSVYAFDDEVTAPLHGFEGADDYYHQCSSKHFYGGVKTDLLIIHSREDTLCPIEFAPFRVIEQNQNIETCFTAKGGHVGFISAKKSWVFRTIIRWLDGI